MHFVNVATGTREYCSYENDIVRLTKHSLISIISGLSQKEFGLDTLNKAITEIRNYKKLYIDKHNSKLFIDSGGYSYIVGDIHPMNVSKMIECYHQYQVSELNNYDKIFSLDIPINLKFFEYNTCDFIYKYNKKSLLNSKNNILQHPELINKFYLVWHFKILKQFKIWNRIVEELELNKIIRNRAIGGMVGLRGIVPIKFAPFIGLGFKLFNDYLTAELLDTDFNLHLLGIYIKTDRFCISFLEKLFSRYLQERNINRTAKLTYDSINFMRTAQLKVKYLEYIHIDNEYNVQYFNDHKNLPFKIYEQIYTNPEKIKEELNNINLENKLNEINAFVPLYVNSNLNIDKLLSHIIDKYKLIDILLDSKNYNSFKNQINSILLTLHKKHSYLFTSSFCNNLKESFKYIYTFHIWFSKYRTDNAKLFELLTKTISNINFPADLKG